MGSTSSKRPNDLSNKNETNFKPLLKRLKVPSKSRKLKFFDSPSRCLKTNKTSNDDWPRKKKKSTTPDETVNELSNPCRPPWTPNPNPEPKPSDRRRSSKATSTTWKSNSDTPTDKPPMLPNKSRSSNLSSRTTSPSSTMLNDDAKTPLNRWLSSNDDPTCSPAKSKNSETPSNKPNEAENWLRPNSTSLTSDLTCSTPRTPLLSTKSENWRPSSNKPRVKLRNPSLNAETLRTKPRKPSLMLLLWPRN